MGSRSCSPPLTVSMLIGNKEPITSLADFKGKKINVLGDYQVANKLRAFGASVVNIPHGRRVFMSAARRHRRDLLRLRLLVPAVWATWSSTSPSSHSPGLVLPRHEQGRLRRDAGRSQTDRRQRVRGIRTYPLQGVLGKKQYESLNTWVSDMGGTLHVLSDADYAEADRLTRPSCGSGSTS